MVHWWILPIIHFFLASFILGSCLAGDAGTDEIEGLVKSLVSLNVEPTIVERGDYRLPVGFDRDVQRGIVDSWDKLLEMDAEVLPILVAHYDDMEYSTSVASTLSEHWHNWTVGQVCREIVKSRIEPIGRYTAGKGDPRERPRRPSYSDMHLSTKDVAFRWLQEHHGQTLREIQIEALDWIIAEEKSQDAESFARDIRFLTYVRAKLSKSPKPLKTSETGYSWIHRLGGYEGN